MQDLQQILDLLKANKHHLYNNYPIASWAIFGSDARNEQKVESDLDILIEFNGQIGIRYIDLADEIEALLGLKIDLVSKNAVRKAYLGYIEDDLIHV
jgi:predicted nucleotidyltransferase